jgi:AcrR family transcriptional regulator
LMTIAGLDISDSNVPRKPERANGKRRYAELVGAAERLLEREGLAHLTIQKIAKEAGVPMASVYHFFPSPTAACLAVAETFLEGFAKVLGEEIAGADVMEWHQIIGVLQRRTIDFYDAHPYASALILGSDRSWYIRQYDLANNKAMAETIARLIQPYFAAVNSQSLLSAITTAISISDAVWALSVAEHGRIMPDYADDALLAVCSYLAAKLGGRSPLK